MSYARNAGICKARAPIVAFLDDDVEAHKDWIINIKQAFETYPEAAYVGGKVLPLWAGSPPKWVRPNLAPLALQDHGSVAKEAGPSWPVCLVSANLACRREVFDTVGPFDPATQRVKNSIGSMEDHEWQMRVWSAGMKGMYVPEMIVDAPVSKERLTRRYHRRWHFGHGSFRSVLRDAASERSAWRWLDVPAHVYRSTGVHLLNTVKFWAQGDGYASFLEECYFLGGLGFIWNRWTHLRGAAAKGVGSKRVQPQPAGHTQSLGLTSSRR